VKILLDENFPLQLYHRLRQAGHGSGRGENRKIGVRAPEPISPPGLCGAIDE
jgi:hypothetical protein